MALTNIALYEALKVELSEDAARMIAEVVPAASDLATKLDVNELRTDIARLDARISDFESRLERRISRWGALFVVPLWGAFVAGAIKLILA